MPKTDTEIVGLFAVERYRINDEWRAELGARQEWQDLSPVDDVRGRPDVDNTATSLSGGLVWEFRPDYNLALSLSRSQRLPNAQETYARGVHLATNTFECGLLSSEFTCGGPGSGHDVEPETSHNVGLNLRKLAGDLTFDAGAFYNRVDDYVYARTLDQIEEFRLIKYTQDEAEFVGGELEMTYRWNDLVSTTLFGDLVRGKLTGPEGDLPRIPADRVGMRVDGTWRDFEAQVEYLRVRDQRRIADFESETPGYNMLNFITSYHLDLEQRYSVYLRGSNLLGEEIFNHSSFLARTVPEPGRNLTVGARVEF
ncbi:Putative outer membrane protein [Salinisphaera shabanensis E1L3A]|uniref:Outer membrane protein n=1 Tax=Salinisphaera shabanensis E1L3A TaxID=1033802 RepID=A0ACB4V5W1_9GAMM|nr:TonB-dependent receptor [Salinisphaera shabanensis]ERJ19028.1 Putative outer membrane protein [Salinisphaera shabanensis E1L3A]